MENGTPKSIKHRCLEYCYTKLGRSSRYSTMHIYAWQIDPPPQCTYIHGKWNPQSIEHRCLEYHYTKLGRSSRYITMHIYTWQIYPLQYSIDVLNTTTPKLAHLADIAQYTYMHGRLTPPPRQSSIDALHTTTPNLAHLADISQCTYMHGRSTPQQSSEHRCLEYCYIKLGRSSRYSTIHIYA